MSDKHHVFLIPGFFGFTNLGDLSYFAHVHDTLRTALAQLGISARIHSVDTHPTATIEARALRLAEAIRREANDDGPLHLVGHSTGALDARLLVTPEMRLPATLDLPRIIKRCQTVVSVATPHHGTPLAARFATKFGQQALRLLSLVTIYVLRFGHVPLTIATKLGALFVRLDDKLGSRNTVMDQIFDQLMADFTEDRRAAVMRLFEDTTVDQGILRDLDPEVTSVFNGETPDRPGIRYGSVVTEAPKPRLGTILHIGFRPYAQATHALYAALFRSTAKTTNIHVVAPTPKQIGFLRAAYGDLPSGTANDGVVPTLSQPWGEVIHATHADHLDVIGHFNQPSHVPPHYDWLASGSGFDRGRL